MKTSIYNMFATIPGSKDYVFMNTLSLCKAILDADTKKALEKGNFNDIDKATLKSLKDMGAVVEDHVDEKTILKVVYQKDVNDTDMLELGVLPTLNCNLACPFCYRIKEEDSKRITGKSITDRVIKFTKKTIIENDCKDLLMGLTGGEPLLVMDRSLRLIAELYNFCEKNGVGFQALIGTNATLLTQEVIDAFSDYPVRFCTSLDGPRDVNDKRRPYTDGKGSYDDIIKSIKRAKKSDMLCRIATTLDKQNIGHFDRYLDNLIDNGLQGASIVLGPTRGDIGTLCDRPPAWIRNHCFLGTELPGVLPKIWRRVMDKKFRLNAFEGTFHENPGRRLQFIIGVYGDVYKSCGGVGSGKKELCIGNLDENGKLNYNPVYYEYMAYDIFSDPKCKDCSVLPICQGKIDTLGLGDDGMMYKGDCESFKELLAGALVVYLEQAYPEAFQS